MSAPTKAARIMALHAKGKSTREIALEVYREVTESRLAYVRVVTRQRRGSYSAADKAYLSVSANLERKRFMVRTRNRWRYQNDPAYRAYQQEKDRRRREKQGAQVARIT